MCGNNLCQKRACRYYQTSFKQTSQESETRNQVDVILQLHKEILLFQRWLKLLSPAEGRICYTDSIACMTKTTTMEKAGNVVHRTAQLKDWQTEGSLFMGVSHTLQFPSLLAWEAQPRDHG